MSTRPARLAEAPAAPADLLIHNAVVVTMDARARVIDRGAILVRDGLVAAVGDDAEFAQAAVRTRVDAMGRIAIPGLVNAHSHAADSLFRGLVEDLPLEPWLQQIWKAEAAILNPETAMLGSLLGFAEQLLGGVTTVMEMYFFPAAAVMAARQLGIRIATGVVAFDDMPIGQSTQPQIDEFFARFDDTPNLRRGSLAHGAYTVAPARIESAYEAAVRNDGFFHIHCAETSTEVATVRARHGASVVRHLHGLGVLSRRTSLAHCVHLDPADIALIAASGASAVHNPVSNLKLGSGFAPIAALKAMGVNIALGTDGALSGNDLDMFLAMRLAATLPRAASGIVTAVSSADALEMATMGGARALGMDRHVGSIEAGKSADVVLVDVDRPSATPMLDAVAQIVHATNRGDVTDVFVGGVRVVRDRRIASTDLPPILERVRGMRGEILASLGRRP